MLNEQEKQAIADCIAGFSIEIVLAGADEKKICTTLDNFHAFFCGALEAAKRDGLKQALVTTLN